MTPGAVRIGLKLSPSTSHPSSSCLVCTSLSAQSALSSLHLHQVCRPDSRTWVHTLASRWVQSQSQSLSAILSQQDSPPNISCSGNQHCFLISPLMPLHLRHYTPGFPILWEFGSVVCVEKILIWKLRILKYQRRQLSKLKYSVL